MSRNYAVKNTIEEAIKCMEMVEDKLELWTVVSMIPDSANLEPLASTRDDKTVSLDLGIRTRNLFTELNEDHLAITFEDNIVGKIPYDAIYCIATSGSLADTLEWYRHKADGEDVAFLNFVTPAHDMPEYLQPLLKANA